MQVINQRLLKLQSKGNVTYMRAEVQIRRKKRSHREGAEGGWEIVKSRGHLDEVQALKTKSANGDDKDADVLILTESSVLGGGAFSRVSIVTGSFLAAPEYVHDLAIKSLAFIGGLW